MQVDREKTLLNSTQQQHGTVPNISISNVKHSGISKFYALPELANHEYTMHYLTSQFCISLTSLSTARRIKSSEHRYAYFYILCSLQQNFLLLLTPYIIGLE